MTALPGWHKVDMVGVRGLDKRGEGLSPRHPLSSGVESTRERLQIHGQLPGHAPGGLSGQG